MKKAPALFLDRDGVINKEKNYLYKIQYFEFLDGIFSVCRHYKSLGYKIVIITNQAGIARGYYNKKDFKVLNEWMLGIFKGENIDIDKVYYCPHHPDGSVIKYTKMCSCRKPLPGMLHQAESDLNIDMKKSILVGDKVSDVLAGKSAGVGTNILITTGHALTSKDLLIANKVIGSIVELL